MRSTDHGVPHYEVPSTLFMSFRFQIIGSLSAKIAVGTPQYHHVLHRTKTYVYRIYLKLLTVPGFSKNSQIPNLMKIPPLEAMLFYADGLTDVTKLIFVFRNLANDTKNRQVINSCTDSFGVFSPFCVFIALAGTMDPLLKQKITNSADHFLKIGSTRSPLRNVKLECLQMCVVKLSNLY
jgi:hypothetical protein